MCFLLCRDAASVFYSLNWRKCTVLKQKKVYLFRQSLITFYKDPIWGSFYWINFANVVNTGHIVSNPPVYIRLHIYLYTHTHTHKHTHPQAPFSIATILMCWGGRCYFPWIARFFTLDLYLFPGHWRTLYPIYIYIYIYIYIMCCVYVCMYVWCVCSTYGWCVCTD